VKLKTKLLWIIEKNSKLWKRVTQYRIDMVKGSDKRFEDPKSVWKQYEKLIPKFKY